MNVKIFPELKQYLPIDIDKCRNYWDEKMNGFMMSSKESEDWKNCEKYLKRMNSNDMPITARTFYLTTKIPFIIANLIIEGEAKTDENSY